MAAGKERTLQRRSSWVSECAGREAPIVVRTSHKTSAVRTCTCTYSVATSGPTECECRHAVRVLAPRASV